MHTQNVRATPPEALSNSPSSSAGKNGLSDATGVLPFGNLLEQLFAAATTEGAREGPRSESRRSEPVRKSDPPDRPEPAEREAPREAELNHTRSDPSRSDPNVRDQIDRDHSDPVDTERNPSQRVSSEAERPEQSAQQKENEGDTLPSDEVTPIETPLNEKALASVNDSGMDTVELAVDFVDSDAATTETLISVETPGPLLVAPITGPNSSAPNGPATGNLPGTAVAGGVATATNAAGQGTANAEMSLFQPPANGSDGQPAESDGPKLSTKGNVQGIPVPGSVPGEEASASTPSRLVSLASPVHSESSAINSTGSSQSLASGTLGARADLDGSGARGSGFDQPGTALQDSARIDSGRSGASEAPQRVANQQELFDRIVKMARFARTGNRSTARLWLQPPSLGSVRVHLTIEKGVLEAHLLTETPAARSSLSSGISELREALARHGLEVGEFQVSVGSQQSGSMSEQDGSGSSSNSADRAISSNASKIDGAMEDASDSSLRHGIGLVDVTI